jgi:hypothetical protein
MCAQWPGSERRRAMRKPFDQTVLLAFPDDAVRPGALRNLTVLGAGLRLQGILVVPEQLELSFDEFQTSLACHLVWRQDDLAGLKFVY